MIATFVFDQAASFCSVVIAIHLTQKLVRHTRFLFDVWTSRARSTALFPTSGIGEGRPIRCDAPKRHPDARSATATGGSLSRQMGHKFDAGTSETRVLPWREPRKGHKGAALAFAAYRPATRITGATGQPSRPTRATTQ